MSYITITLNHFRVIQAWVAAHNAEAKLDMSNFEMEVKAHNRYFRMHPRFVARIGGRLAHLDTVTTDVHGFIGWLPYRPVRWALSTDKLVFKRFLSDAGLPTPASAKGEEPLPRDYLFKRSVGSFGYELYGPYRADDATARPPPPAPTDRGELFKEEFIAGRNVKVWFWGDTPFYAHLQAYPLITGDGKTSVYDLIANRLADVDEAVPTGGEMACMQASLAFQRLTTGDVLAPGRTAWIDYRYGRLFEQVVMSTTSDSRLAQIEAEASAQLGMAGTAVARELAKEFPAPVLYSLDGVLDKAGKIWWLEMNSNPVFPPDGYTVMLDSLFGIQRSGSRNLNHA